MRLTRRHATRRGPSTFSTLHRQRRLIGLSYRRLAVVSVVAFVSSVAQAGLLLIIVRTVTALTAEDESIDLSIGPLSLEGVSISQMIIAGFILLAISLAAELMTAWTLSRLQADAQRTVRRRLLAAFSAASFPSQLELSRGESTQLMLEHAGQSGMLVARAGQALSATIGFVTLVGSAVILSPIAASLVLAGIVVTIIALRPLAAWARRLGHRRVRRARLLSSRLLERLELNREVRAFGVTREANAVVNTEVDAVARIAGRLQFVLKSTAATSRLLAFALVLGILAFIDASGPANLASLTGAMLILLRSMTFGQSVQDHYQHLNAEIPVVVDLAEHRQRWLDSVAPEPLSVAAPSQVGDLELRGVHYAYPGGERVLHGIDLCIRAGGLTAMVGRSGGGKTTIMQILLRLREPTSGLVLAGNLPVNEIGLDWWTSHVAYVPQEPRLLAGSVTEAIRFHREHITDDQVRRAAEQAHIAGDIARLAAGYETDVGQLGENLSGGQRQRLAIARAIAGDPEVLLLDEPTSALDPRSEALIADTLATLRGHMTILVIAHRQRTVRDPDDVIVVENGRVVVPDESFADLARTASSSPVQPTD
ncbi:MAG: ABC transporter ATP-binding protein/permease [Actinomycetota bacterium]|nr:ABC transporter ATP-binding protein/permease [Actinomycetota bacterium]